MSKILNEIEKEKFKKEFLNDCDIEVFNIILSIEENLVICIINGEVKKEFNKRDVEHYL